MEQFQRMLHIADSLIALDISQFCQKSFSWVKQWQQQKARTENIFANIALKDCIGDILPKLFISETVLFYSYPFRNQTFTYSWK